MNIDRNAQIQALFCQLQKFEGIFSENGSELEAALDCMKMKLVSVKKIFHVALESSGHAIHKVFDIPL